MPSYRVGDGPVALGLYDVLGGTHSKEGPPHYVRHVGLSLEEEAMWGETPDPVDIRASHMQPPFVFDPPMKVTFMGTAEPTLEEAKRLEFFAVRTREEFDRVVGIPEAFPEGEQERYASYTVVPHHREPDEECPAGRYSCSGFVYEAYNAAGIGLVDLDSIPALTIREVGKVYPEFQRACERGKTDLLKWMGLEGGGPWRILMPGYILNALDRDRVSIRKDPYRPTQRCLSFPPIEE